MHCHSFVAMFNRAKIQHKNILSKKKYEGVVNRSFTSTANLLL